jgi:hypothetical protein
LYPLNSKCIKNRASAGTQIYSLFIPLLFSLFGYPKPYRDIIKIKIITMMSSVENALSNFWGRDSRPYVFFKMRPHKDTSLGESASVKVEGMNTG